MKLAQLVFSAYTMYLIITPVKSEAKFLKECAEEVGMDPPKFEKEEWAMYKMITKKAKCFYKCLGEKNDIFSTSGEPNLDKMKEMFKLKETHVEKIKKCADEVDEDDPCERVAAMRRCVFRFAPKI